MENFRELIANINLILWNETWILIIAGTGLVFTVWSGFIQYKALTQGPRIVAGFYNNNNDPGAISHFQALSAALSGTVGLGNIGGVALAISLGGPGAIFWMWIVGLLGMSIKFVEVTLAMMYRNTDDPENPRGGPMWVAGSALKKLRPELAWLGKTLAFLYAFTVMISSGTGGNMFQAWNVADITNEYFNISGWVTGIILTLAVACVIIGGIKRIGKVTGILVPFMVVIYILAGIYVLFQNYNVLPELLKLIVVSAFTPTEATGAFIGGTMGSAFLFGMKRAIFSNEAGQGSSAIAHAAAKTKEPVREGLVAGMEPFIDTVIVCTFTALIILSTGVWNRVPDLNFEENPKAILENGVWQFPSTKLPNDGEWQHNEALILIVNSDINIKTGQNIHRISGTVKQKDSNFIAVWKTLKTKAEPKIIGNGLYQDHVGATLTAKALDTAAPGLGKWLITIASWLFGISTIIAWGYYGEQGAIYIMGKKSVLPYRITYCSLTFLATLGHIKTSSDLDNLTGIGLGVIVYANLPICWLLAHQAINEYKNYQKKINLQIN